MISELISRKARSLSLFHSAQVAQAYVSRKSQRLIMVIGPSGVQFGLYLYESLTKSDDRESGVRFVYHEHDY